MGQMERAGSRKPPEVVPFYPAANTFANFGSAWGDMKSLGTSAERVLGRLARSPGAEKLLKRPCLIFLHLLNPNPSVRVKMRQER